MEHGPSLALPPPEEDAARASAEEAGKVKEREGVEKDEKGLMTPTRSTTGPPGSATGPTTEMEVFRSGGSKPSAKGSTEHPKGRPVTLAPLVPLQQQMAPLFTNEQLKESRAAARMAPQVFGKPPPPSSSEEQVELLQRPAFLQEEEERFGGKKRAPGGYEEDESEELRRCDDEDSEGAQGRRRSRLQEEQEEEIMWRWQISQDMKKLTSLCQDQQRENDRLQQELYEWRLEDAERKRQEEDKKKKRRKRKVMCPEVHRRSTLLKKRSPKLPASWKCWVAEDALHGLPTQLGMERGRDLNPKTHREREEVLRMERGSRRIQDRPPKSLQWGEPNLRQRSSKWRSWHCSLKA